jgi:hypothetical protein
MSNSTIPQFDSLRQRLNRLNLQKAQYGISADPHISMEAQDLETLLNQMGLIDIHRRNLDTLLKQAGTFGQHVPMHISNQIISERAEVTRLRQVCARLGQGVPAHPVDDDEPAPLPPIQPRRQNPPPTDDIRTKLTQIEWLITEIRAALDDDTTKPGA